MDVDIPTYSMSSLKKEESAATKNEDSAEDVFEVRWRIERVDLFALHVDGSSVDGVGGILCAGKLERNGKLRYNNLFEHTYTKNPHIACVAL